MIRRWAASIDRKNAAAVAPLRRSEGVMVCEQEGIVWLQGSDSADWDRRLRAIAGLQRFDVVDQDSLTAPGKLVPIGRLPQGPWTPIDRWFQCELPSRRFAGRGVRQAAVQLVRSDQFDEPTLLLLRWSDWFDYSVTAPQIRLEGLCFAVDANHRAIVQGRPLPPLPGQFHVVVGGIAAPAGWRWDPPVDAVALRASLEKTWLEQGGGVPLQPEDLVLFAKDGSWEVVPHDAMTSASRSTIRRTAESLHDRG